MEKVQEHLLRPAGIRSVQPTLGPGQGRREEMSDLKSARVPHIPLVKKIIAQLIIVLSLRLVRLILSRDGPVFYSYREVWENET